MDPWLAKRVNAWRERSPIPAREMGLGAEMGELTKTSWTLISLSLLVLIGLVYGTIHHKLRRK